MSIEKICHVLGDRGCAIKFCNFSAKKRFTAFYYETDSNYNIFFCLVKSSAVYASPKMNVLIPLSSFVAREHFLLNIGEHKVIELELISYLM